MGRVGFGFGVVSEVSEFFCYGVWVWINGCLGGVEEEEGLFSMGGRREKGERVFFFGRARFCF